MAVVIEYGTLAIQELIPPAYVAWRAGKTNRLVVPARQAGHRFLGSLKGLQIRAQVCLLYNFVIVFTSSFLLFRQEQTNY